MDLCYNTAMAEKIVNSGIVFAYATNDAVFEIKRELERYFLYQTVLVVDESFEYGQQIENLRQMVNCNILVSHSFKDFDFSQNVDFVIAINDKNAFDIKEKCFQDKIPYMIVLTKVVTYSACSDKVFGVDNKQSQVNKPFGIVLDKSQVFDKKRFVCQAILEIGLTNFEIVQKNIENLFYGKKIAYETIDAQKKNLESFEQLFEQKNYDNNLLFNQICDIYLTNLLKKSSETVGLLEVLASLYCGYDSKMHGRYIETKYLYMQILCVIENDFFSKYKSGYKDVINYQIHQKKLAFYGKNSDFLPINLPESKINFLIEQFQNKFLQYMKQQNDFAEKIKNLLADTDIDFLYQIYNDVDRKTFVDMLSLTPTIFKEQNILSLMYSLGLLNYGI